MNIEGLSDKTITKYFNLGFIKSISDIYRLNNHRVDIIEKTANGKFKVFNKIIDAINTSKNRSLEKLLIGLGIRNVGAVSALNLAKHFKNIDNLADASIEELTNLNDVGLIVANSIYHFFHDVNNQKLINDLKQLGLNTNYLGNNNIKQSDKDSPYYQKTFCITGSFDISRNEISDLLIKKFDAKVVNSVSKSLDYLIVGENAGSKEQKAKDLGIKIINTKIWED